MNRTIIWPEQIRAKLRSFRSPHFTIHESLDKISQVILEAEELLTTPSLTQTYIEEFGRYKVIPELSSATLKYTTNVWIIKSS